MANAIKKRLNKEEGQKGFTLIELLAVIVILGIIAVIAIPLIGNIINNSKDNADVATARQVYDAARLYVIGEEDGDFNAAGGVTIDEMQEAGYLDDPITLPSTKAEITGGTVNFNDQGQLANSGTTATGAVSFTTGTGTSASSASFSASEVLSAKKN
ncbi:prepilin-type cleavage/methylation domain-containing protein [Paenibacillus sp. PK3_47]|nr:prepilin-type cleavage/methylation domain-containing protein [Paenibacillus sp. PK3_47]